MGTGKSKYKRRDQSFQRGPAEPVEDRADVLPCLWYRHSGEPLVVDYRPTQHVHERQIARDLGENHITHMYIENGVIPALADIAPQLTHLQIGGISVSSQLDRLNSLTQLKELDLSYNNLSKGLPAVIPKLTSLEKLSLIDCNLTDLPQSVNSLTKLKQFDLANNNFGDGFPDVITQLISLEILSLEGCKLTDLPQRLGCETLLKSLNLSYNNFSSLPPAVHHMSNLKRLRLAHNEMLEQLGEEFSRLQKLEELECQGCESLQSPPYEVCVQGFRAVKTYFSDLKVGKGKELLLVPVAVVGMKGSGKSSLIKSLQAGQRELTFRDENSLRDETTKVFDIEELQLKSYRVKFVDYGGHEIYHLAYQLVIKERCIALIVVNLHEFRKLSLSEGVEEASRKLCIDWCSHLYLACPRLGPPLLILTHTDKLAVDEVKQCKEQLLATSEVIRKKIINEIKQCSGEFSKSAQKMVHFANERVPLFNPVDVFEFNNDLTERSNLDTLKVSLDHHCKSFKVEIPRLWEKVEEFVNEHDTESYISLSEVTSKFSFDDPQIILQYMHNVGKILWFEEIKELKPYIFHNILAITEMISLLLHHSSDEQWKQRVADFDIFLHNGDRIGPHKYQSLVDEFTSTGVIDEALLAHTLETGSRFPTDLAIDLLKGFFILHGPIQQSKQIRQAYILSCVAPSSLDCMWKTAGPVPLRLEIVFSGLSPPQYVYQLMTVIVLNQTSCVLTDVTVKSNGVMIHHGRCSTSLIHDASHGKITLQVSTPVAQLYKSWKHLVKTSTCIIHQLSRVWKACHAEFLVYCARCLFLQCPNPGCDVDPYWLHSTDENYDSTRVRTVTTNSALEEVRCTGCSSSTNRTPDVPKPFKFPCEELSEDDIHQLDEHISAIKQSYSAISADLLPHVTTVAKQAEGGEEQKAYSFHDIAERMSVPGESLESTIANVDTEIAADKNEIKVDPSNNVYTQETTKEKEINNQYDGEIEDLENSSLIQEKIFPLTGQAKAEVRIGELEAKVAELHARIAYLEAKNFELVNELAEQKFQRVTSQARDETDELKGITKNIEIPFQDTVQDVVAEFKHSGLVHSKQPEQEAAGFSSLDKKSLKLTNIKKNKEMTVEETTQNIDIGHVTRDIQHTAELAVENKEDGSLPQIQPVNVTEDTL